MCARRQELFDLINGLPTCYEVVSGRAARKRPTKPTARAAAASKAARLATVRACGLCV